MAAVQLTRQIQKQTCSYAQYTATVAIEHYNAKTSMVGFTVVRRADEKASMWGKHPLHSPVATRYTVTDS